MSRQTRSAGDEIEFLTPNDAAFGMADSADFVGFDGADDSMFDDDGPRSRWLPAIAGVVVLGLLGGGVIAAAPWDQNAVAPTPTTTPPTSTSTPAPTTTERVIDVAAAGQPGFVLDTPGEFQVAGAWSAGAGARPSTAYATDQFDLWTTPDASRTSGRWLAVAGEHSRDGYEQMWRNAVRVSAGLDKAVVIPTDDGVTRLSFTAIDGTPFEVGGFGFSLADLLAVAAEVTVAEDESIDYGSLTDTVLTGLTPTLSQPVQYGTLDGTGLVAQPDADVYYMAPGLQQSLEVRLSTPTELDDAVLDFLTQPVVDLGVDDQAALDAMARSGRVVRLSARPEYPQYLAATWIEPSGLVTVWGNDVSVSTLIRVLADVRPAEPLEWATLVDRSNRGELVVTEQPTQEASTQIGQRDPGADGLFWHAEMTSYPISVFVSTNNTGWGGQLGPTSTQPTVHHFSSASITFLVATVEWPNDARRIRVTLEGLPPVEIPMVQVGDSTVYAAAYAYTEMLPERVEFLDAQGNPVTG